MREFSWYTDDKPHISTYLNGAPKKRYLVVDGIAVIGRAVMHYKPNRKGGHTHFHCFNAKIRKYDRRKIKHKFKRDLLIAEFSNIMCMALDFPPLYNLDPNRINQINRVKKRRSIMACRSKKSGGKKPPKK